ncbi:MAG: phosphatidylglycerophosphatase A [Pseudomonadota bacterium]
MIAQLIGTVCGVGYLRPGPGTWGSAAALPLGWLLHVLGGVSLVMIATIALFAAGWWATHKIIRGSDDHDPSEVVVDEVVGQWIALLPLSYAASSRGLDVLDLWPGWISAFVLFRLFDIWKPWLVGRADRRGDALGVMLDDVVAGAFAAIGVLLLAAIAHGIIL